MVDQHVKQSLNSRNLFMSAMMSVHEAIRLIYVHSYTRGGGGTSIVHYTRRAAQMGNANFPTYGFVFRKESPHVGSKTYKRHSLSSKA